jgi:hypothetical protein
MRVFGSGVAVGVTVNRVSVVPKPIKPLPVNPTVNRGFTLKNMSFIEANAVTDPVIVELLKLTRPRKIVEVVP